MLDLLTVIDRRSTEVITSIVNRFSDSQILIICHMPSSKLLDKMYAQMETNKIADDNVSCTREDGKEG
jgi:hypothetical protein